VLPRVSAVPGQKAGRVAQRRPQLTRSGSTSGSSLPPLPFSSCLALRCALLVKGVTTTTTSADFCPITTAIPSRRAMSLRRSARALMIQFRPFWNYGSAAHRYVRQISPGKDMNLPRTTAAFTLSAAPAGLRHEVPTRPQTRPSMQFLSVSSRFCTRASSAQILTDLHLPSASGYPCRMRQVRYSHRGLSPHKFMPMLGAHPAVQGTLRDKAAQRP
jgi:hypothetical protein